ncbi:MAG: 3-phenylpropionate/cinnamic acid dioxygenase subunit beta [Actinomycetota bacterium]
MSYPASIPDIELQELADSGTPLPYIHPLHQAAAEFLTTEAHVLDRRDFQRWLSMLTPDVNYRVPVRVTAVASTKRDDLLDMDHFYENYHTLRVRVRRLETEHAWAEDPPSRTRRFVTNLRVFEASRAGELMVESYLLLYRSRGDLLSSALLSGARLDLLRREGDECYRLARRLVILDDAVVGMQNLAVFL